MVRRHGRRPRFHRGTIASNEVRRDAPQCNLDDVSLEVVRLDRLPTVGKHGMVRPWSQLCRRCWRGTKVLAAADAIRGPDEERRRIAHERRFGPRP